MPGAGPATQRGWLWAPRFADLLAAVAWVRKTPVPGGRRGDCI